LTFLAYCPTVRFTSFPTFSLRQRFHGDKRGGSERRPRVNEQITSPEVLLISDDESAEKLPVAVALERARQEGLDLIEVSPKANPPVVKIGEYGHFLYQMQKKERKQRSGSKQVELKTLRFGFRTAEHDLKRLQDRAREFLGERHLVKFTMRLRGRELGNKEYAYEKFRSVVQGLTDVAEVDQDVKRQGNQFIAVIRPK